MGRSPKSARASRKSGSKLTGCDVQHAVIASGNSLEEVDETIANGAEVSVMAGEQQA